MKKNYPSHDTVIHFDDRGNYSGFPMEFRDREKADEMLASGEEIELEQFYTDRIDTKDEFLGAFDFEEEGETWYRFPITQEAKDSIGKTEENEDNSTGNKEAVEFGETATVEKFNGAKFEITIDNFEISNGNELVVNYTVKNVSESAILPYHDAGLYLGTEEDRGKAIPFTDNDIAEKPLEPGDEVKLGHTYSSDDLDENKEYILRAATNDVGGGETKFNTK